jgi:hypothetical protein
MVLNTRKQKHKYVLIIHQNAKLSSSTLAILYSVHVLSISKLINYTMTRGMRSFGEDNFSEDDISIITHVHGIY